MGEHLKRSTSGQLVEIYLLSSERGITDYGICELLRRCPVLKSIDLNISGLSADIIVPVLAGHCRLIETIRL